MSTTNFGNRETIAAGRIAQAKLKETPNSFGTVDGAASVTETSTMDSTDQRMAGQEGARALAMLTDPIEQKRTARWKQEFYQSPTSIDWRIASMDGGLAPAPEPAPESKEV